MADFGTTQGTVGNGIGSRFVQTYTTFSGVDITAMFDNKTMLPLSGISVSITREKAPVYSFGSATARSISRGKRGIAGSFVFTLFDRTAFLDIMDDPAHWYYAHKDEVNWLRKPTNVAAPNRVNPPTAADALNYADLGEFEGGGLTVDGTNYVSNLTSGSSADASAEFSSINANGAITSNREGPGVTASLAGEIVDGQAVTVLRAPIYADQVFPFDITLVGQNEYGQAGWCSIEGIEIINEGNGLSVDDITNEEQFTYIAIHKEPWRPINAASDEGEIRAGSETAFIRNKSGIYASVDGGPASAQFAPFWSRSVEGIAPDAQPAPT